MLVPTLLLAVLVGVSLGLLGGGGSILTVPLLVYVAGLDANAAVATSLAVVGAVSAAGAIRHARAGTVDWRTAAVFAPAGMVGAYLGGRLGALVPGTVLLIAFAVLLVVTSVAMLRPSSTPEPTGHGDGRIPVVHVLLHGLVVGAVTGFVGAGGGFLVVPALVVLGGLPMHTAVGTSLVVIATKSFAGLLGHGLETVDVPLAIGFTLAAALGAVVASGLGRRIDARHLRDSFGWFVLVVGVAVLAVELPPSLRTNPFVLLAALATAFGVFRALRTGAAEEHEPDPDDPDPHGPDDPHDHRTTSDDPERGTDSSTTAHTDTRENERSAA